MHVPDYPRAGTQAYVITSLGMIAVGVGFLVGPPRWQESSTYDVVRSIAPIDVWSIAFFVIGTVKLWVRDDTHSRRIMSAVGGGHAIAWGMALAATMFTGALTNWSAVPAWFIIGAVQLGCAANLWRDV